MAVVSAAAPAFLGSILLPSPRPFVVRNRAVLIPCRCIQSSASTSSPSRRVTKTRLRTPTHLIRFQRSRLAAHLTELQLRGFPTPRPDASSRIDRALANAGSIHEQCVLARLASLVGSKPVSIPRGDPDRYRITADALTEGLPLIHQPALTDGELFEGYGDILLRNSHNPFLPTHYDLPENGYSVIEVKLASTVKADYALQAAAYTDMLARTATRIGIPSPGPPLLWLGTVAEEPTCLEATDSAFFFTSVRSSFETFLESFDPSAPLPPIDAPLYDLAPWEGAMRERLVESDSILQVAGVRRSQVSALEHAGILTMEQLADMTVDQIVTAVDSVGRQPLEALQKQAELQVASRSQGQCTRPVFELIRSQPESAPSGLHRLPRHCPGDVFFDMEGFPLVPGGLEYLFGATELSNRDKTRGEFHAWWAHDRNEEESQCAAFVGWLWNRWQRWGRSMHVYHYGHYEVTALRRVTSRSSTGLGVGAARKFEEMVEDGVFVDIYKHVKASLRVGEPSYSIKNIEKLIGVSRVGDELADAESSVAMYYEWRRLVQKGCNVNADFEGKTSSADMHSDVKLLANVGGNAQELLEDIERYNRQDCESLCALVQWLRKLCAREGIEYSRWLPVPTADAKTITALTNGKPLARGSCGPTPERKIADSEVIRYGDQLCQDILNGEVSELNRTLAYLTGFHARESAPARGRFADRVLRASSGDTVGLFHDDQSISMLRKCHREAQGGGDRGDLRRRPTWFYSLDPLERHRFVVGDGAALVIVQNRAVADSDDSLDPVAGFVRIRETSPGMVGLDLGAKLGKDDSAPVSASLVSSDDLIICPSSLRASIVDSVSRVVRDRAGAPPLVLSYLQKLGFRAKSSSENTDLSPDVFDSGGRVRRGSLPQVLANMVGKTFIIQGPPGTGKTVICASLILDLVLKYQKTVAVSSNSHAAIDNLLERAVSSGVPAEFVKKIGPKNPSLDCKGIGRLSNISKTHVAPLPFTVESQSAKNVACVVGATAYALSSQEAVGKFDYIFVDEAGQVPMANFIAMAPCADAAVLVGDQQQLDMPIQGQHPDAVRKSCLTYFIGDDIPIVPAWQGIFLDTSYRMSPPLCSFISGAMYQKSLLSAGTTAAHTIRLTGMNSLPPAVRPILQGHDELSGIVFVDRDPHLLSPEQLHTMQRGKRHCPSEVMLTKQVFEELIGSKYFAKGESAILMPEDILVVAPYNVQVASLLDALPEGSRVGTIDKFQGQEAPVVIVSTCALPEKEDSDTCDEPGLASLDLGVLAEQDLADNRGTWFALDRKRMNVALSRAQCLAIVIGSKSLNARAKVRSLEEASLLSFYSQIIKAGERG